MKINELFIDSSQCKGNSCPCDAGHRCWEISSDLFLPPPGPNSPAQLNVTNFPTVPLELQDEAEWAIFRCWEAQKPGDRGAIWGRGEPDLPEPI